MERRVPGQPRELTEEQEQLLGMTQLPGTGDRTRVSDEKGREAR